MGGVGLEEERNEKTVVGCGLGEREEKVRERVGRGM